MHKLLRCLYRWTAQLVDPLRVLNGLKGFSWYFPDWRKYAGMDGAEEIRLLETWPQLHDRTGTSGIDHQYFYVNGWAARRILSDQPDRHVDVASQAMFANLLAAVLPVIFVDYRPLKVELPRLVCLGGSILALPFASGSIDSLSCLHVAEHIGLGRYGDPLDPQGTRKATLELFRVLAPGGNLYFAVPVGRPRLCFNSQRIHSVGTIRDYFSKLELMEFSGVHDDGRFLQGDDLSEFEHSEYACGMFWFRKPPE
ncbi:MAG: DUF268 domain-containing protein [Deltaproteobacteria bacterium]|nr:MAG: DUF268 domain-containing protein [Deltaproteobacteria bacterium]